MKGIRFVELLANIKANLVAFFSISMFVCLGIGLFLGIHWGSVALRDAAQNAFDEGNVYDIEVQFPYGITTDDIAKLKEVEGVSNVETGYTAYVTMKDGSTNYTLKMETINKGIDVATSVQGNMPMEKDEVALLKTWAEKQGISVGDAIKLNHDFNAAASEKDDPDGMQYLNSDTFTVTALVDNPEYLNTMSASLGVSNIGSGVIDCVGFVLPDAFDASQYMGGYPNVYIRCDSLEGLSTFDAAYRDAVEPIADAITKLGGDLGTARYKKVHDDAQQKIDEAQQKITEAEEKLSEGERQLTEGEQQLAEGRQKLDEGQKTLVDEVSSAASQQSDAQKKLDDAYRTLSDGQAKYDAGLQSYNQASSLYNQARSEFDSVRDSYDRFIALYDTLQANQGSIEGTIDGFELAANEYANAGDDTLDSSRQVLEAAYNDLKSAYDEMSGSVNQMNSLANIVANALDMPLSLSDLGDLGGFDPNNAPNTAAIARDASNTLDQTLDRIANASLTVGDTTIYLTDIPGGLDAAYDKLAASKATLDSSKQQLDAGWDEYDKGKAEYDKKVAEGQEQLKSGEKQLEEGKQTLEDKSKELEEGKKTLEEKTQQLEEGKEKFADAKAEFDKLEEYEWVVMPRLDNGGVQSLTMISKMMDSVKWAMASLFIIVGLFVCYSAISRLVHEQVVQIGTKKALGFREGEIARGYLAFSGLGVLIGVALSVALAVFLVQAIMNPTAARQFAMPEYGPYVGLPDVLLVGSIELVLILAATWVAIHGMLKRQAVDLLRGESTANVKERFYERTRLWQKMSLYSQTIVNNCINDKRRVAGTLIGVVGCTALIVTAVTLQGNVSKSFTRHYQEVYSFDSIVYLDGEGDQKVDNVAMVLYDRGIASTPAFTRSLQVRKADGTRSLVRLVVPTNEESFKKFYDVVSTEGGDADVEGGGLWMSAAYGEHMGVKAGDEVTLTEYTGKTHDFKIAGFFDYYLIRQEFVLSQMEYREAFGVKPQANVLLVNTDGADLDHIRDALVDVEGYSSLADDKGSASYAFDEMERLLRTVVLIYLALSALMAVVVLLNLDVMFVDEKKRELIVLMINGFSVKDVKAYIYRDSIALTVIGVFLGVLLGAVMGAITVFALEPDTGYFIKGFNWIAAAVGVVGAGVFATAVLLYALRRIPRFKLTDVNRY